MISSILDPRSLPYQTILFVFALAYFYIGISLSPELALPLKSLFGFLFFLGLFSSHLLLVPEERVNNPFERLAYGGVAALVLSVFVLAGSILFIIPGIVLYLLLFPAPALASSERLFPAEATKRLFKQQGPLLKALANRLFLHALLLVSFFLFFGLALLLLAHGNLQTAFFSLTRPGMIHELLIFLFLIVSLPPYTASVRRILRIS